MADPVTDVIVGVAIVLVAAAGLGAFRWAKRIGQALRDLVEHVLPHYVPADPGERDVTVPGRLAELEVGQEAGREDLRRHMANEETTLELEAEARRVRQEALDARLDGLAGQLEHVDAKLDGAGATLVDHDARIGTLERSQEVQQ